MAHAFQTISAKPTFGTIKENLFQSDYINRKKANIAFCKYPSRCFKFKQANSYNEINLYNHQRYNPNLGKCNLIPVNKNNLVFGQYSSTNLQNVCEAVSQPINNTNISNCFNSTSNFDSCVGCTNIVMNVNNTPGSNYGKWNGGSSKIFYQEWYIDPIGELFGNTQCGELNYTDFMNFNPRISI